MEAGHGNDPCDPIGGGTKRKADQTGKIGKYVIQDAICFLNGQNKIPVPYHFPMFLLKIMKSLKSF